MRTILLKTVLLLLFVHLSMRITHAQDCDDCSHPRVAFYDFAVNVPQPTQPDSLVKWKDLFWPGPFARGYIHDQYSSSNCLTFYDGAMINASERQNGTLRFGNEYTNLPPSGPIPSADYIITGEVNSVNGAYSVKISLEAAFSREVVASGYATFSTSDPNACSNAGISVAKQISPLLSTIKNFEKKKRDTDTKVALRDLWNKNSTPEIIITPAKKEVDINQMVDVEIKMIDCDGVPLGQREIQLSEGTFQGMLLQGPVGGKFAQNTVVTDNNGIAKTQFIVGSKKCLGVLYVYYVHQKPNGKDACFMGTGYMNIKQPVTRYYQFNAVISKTVTYKRDTSSSSSVFGVNIQKEHSDFAEDIYNASITAILENESYEAGVLSFGTAISPISVNGSGNYSAFDLSRTIEKWNGSLMSADIRNDNYGGGPLGAKTGVEIIIDSTSQYLHIGIPFTRKGSYLGHWWDGKWNPYDGKYNDTSGGTSVGFTADPGIYMTKTDSGYTISYSGNETEYVNSSIGMATITTAQTIQGKLIPYNKLTAVENGNFAVSPDKYFLGQNYPNPFNPSTRIRYYLPEKSFVTIKVYDILGNELKTLVNHEMPKGSHTAEFDGSDLSAGVYFYRMHAGNYNDVRKMLLLK